MRFCVAKSFLENWKSIFVANAEIAMEPAKAVKEYKEPLANSKILSMNSSNY